MKRQPRAKSMLPAIKELIVMRALGDEDKDRNLLARELREEIKEKFPQQLPPTVTTLIKKISESRNHATDPFDRAWHLGILNKLHDYGMSYISADEIDAILRVQDWLFKTAGQALNEKLFKKKKVKGIRGITTLFHTVSIRQAKWISALHRNIGNDTEYLWLASLYYAYREIISSISDTPFDTWQIDMWLHLGKTGFLNKFRFHMQNEQKVFGEDFEKALSILNKAEHTDKLSEEDIKKALDEYEGLEIRKEKK